MTTALSTIWDRFGGKKLLVIAATFIGYLTGGIPDATFHDALLAFFGAQALADVAAYWGGKAKEKAAQVIDPKPVTVETPKAVVTDTQDAPATKPDFGE